MRKITVRDTFKEFHIFKGNVRCFVSPDNSCQVIELLPAKDGGGRKILATFGPHIFGWAKEEEIEDDRPRNATEVRHRTEEVDRYTADALAGRDPHETPDFHTIGSKPLDLVMKGPIKFPEGTEFNEDGSIIIPPATPSLDDLKASGLLKTAAEIAPTPAQAVRERFMADNVSTMDSQNRQAWIARLPAEEREAFILTALEQKEAQKPEKPKRARPSRAKKKVGEVAGIPVIEDPAMPPGRIELQDKDGTVLAAADLAETDPDPADAIAAAEQRHAKRQASDICDTCAGDGTVPDPDSDDPLDTMMCPDC